METKTFESTISVMSYKPSKDDESLMVYCCDTPQGSLSTKKTLKSYVVALEGNPMPLKFVLESLEEGDFSILRGCSICWERTIIPANQEYKASDGSVVLKDCEWYIDHITKVDIAPIYPIIFDLMLEDLKDKLQVPLYEALIKKQFELDW